MTVTVDLTGWLRQLNHDIDLGVLELANTIKSVEEGMCADRASWQRFGLVHVEFDALDEGARKAVIERSASNCFRATIATFISFLDKLIAAQRAMQEGIRFTKDIEGEEEILRYLDSYLAEKVSEVARDLSLSNHKKLACFPALSDFSRRAAIGYFALRRCLEHHQGVVDKEFELLLLHQQARVDGVVVASLPQRATEKIELVVSSELRRYSAGTRISLDPADVFAIAFTIKTAVAPEAFGVRLQWKQEPIEFGETDANGRRKWQIRYSPSIAPSSDTIESQNPGV
jgi:hypothetical protein